MQKFLLLLFLFSTQTCFSQTGYDLFKFYNTTALKKQNAAIKSVTGFRILKSGLRKIQSYRSFSAAGLPTKIVEYDENSTEIRTIIFMYTAFLQPSNITIFQKGKKSSASEFYYDADQRLTYFKDYGYSTLDQEKNLLWLTNIEYYNNKKISRMIRLEASNVLPVKDTVEILSFDSSGKKTAGFYHLAGPPERYTYKWNAAETVMEEQQYQADSLVGTTIHRYENGNEIESKETGSEKPALFWKYDKQDRLIQTNVALYFMDDLTYNANGYLIKESWTATFPELLQKNADKVMRFVYEYAFRK